MCFDFERKEVLCYALGHKKLGQFNEESNTNVDDLKC